jgi:ribosomal protein S18 acetylase RimI-like enzyme
MIEKAEIRSIGPGDREALLTMYRTFDPLGAAQGLPPASEEGRRSWIDRLVREALNWGAFSTEGRCLGHSILAESAPGEAEIAFFVHQSFRCRRLGTRLASTALAAARSHGHYRVWASVCADNVPALRLLRGRGFGRAHLSFPTVELELFIEQRQAVTLRAAAKA